MCITIKENLKRNIVFLKRELKYSKTSVYIKDIMNNLFTISTVFKI